MHVLVTVASRHGATRALAEALTAELDQGALTATLLEPAEVASLEGYDAVVLGSAVYAGSWLPAARELVARCAVALRERPVWLLSSGPIGDPPKPAGAPAEVAALLEETGAREHRVLPGRLERRRLGRGERAVVALVRAPDGDFRDWEAVRAWAAEIRDALASEAPGAGADRDQPEAPLA